MFCFELAELKVKMKSWLTTPINVLPLHLKPKSKNGKQKIKV